MAAAEDGPLAGAGPPSPAEPDSRAMISVSLSVRTGSTGAAGAERPVRRRNTYMPIDPSTIRERRPGWCGGFGSAIGTGFAAALADGAAVDDIVAAADAAMTPAGTGPDDDAGAPMMIGGTADAVFAGAAAFAAAGFAFAGVADRGPAGPLRELRRSEAPSTTPTVASGRDDDEKVETHGSPSSTSVPRP